MISLVVPIYKNSGNIPSLLAAIAELHRKLGAQLRAVFVVDGSPDDSYLQLSTRLPAQPFRSQLVLLSRNYGSFAAIRAGLELAEGDAFAVMAADLQEPPELILAFAQLLAAGDCDVVVGVRIKRDDPLLARVGSGIFWALYRRLIMPQVPPGGVDIFGCNRLVRDQLIRLREGNSSLIGLLFWLGFRRREVPYERQKRQIGVSAWTLNKRVRYLMDSVFGFTDLPVRLLIRIGVLGLLVSLTAVPIILIAKILGDVPVPGYTATVLTIIFFGALNCFGLGIVGSYVWRTFENTKLRPNFIVASCETFSAPPGASAESNHG